jgi:lysozyme
MRPVPQIALDFIAGAEADELKAYRDSRGIWTIGQGHTGPEVVEGLEITEAQSLSYRITDATLAARRLALVVKDATIQALTSHEYAALISFVFNLGQGRGDWGIWKDLNGANLGDVPNQMMLFDKARINGVETVVPGLLHRRMAEVALWKAPDTDAALAIVQSAPVAAPPSSFTRDSQTPPTEVSAKPQLKSKTFVGSCLTACAAAVTPFAGQVQGGLKTVNDTLTPYVGQSEILQHIQGEVVLGLAGLATLTAVFAYLKNKAPGQ